MFKLIRAVIEPSDARLLIMKTQVQCVDFHLEDGGPGLDLW